MALWVEYKDGQVWFLIDDDTGGSAEHKMTTAEARELAEELLREPTQPDGLPGPAGYWRQD